MPLPIGRLVKCLSCGQIRLHHAKNLCITCYNQYLRERKHQYVVFYFAEYRARPSYKEQRQAYDIKYQLKNDPE
jgi:hypothetical protein